MPELESRLHIVLADRYRIERELGAGGMATVVARDTVLADTYVYASNPHANYDVMPETARTSSSWSRTT